MRSFKHNLIKNDFPFSFSELSYESYIFSHLYNLHLFLESEKQPHAFFGGSAVAAYIGYLPRNLHDVDIIIPQGEESKLVSYMNSEGFREIKTKKAGLANFSKFLYEDDRYQMIISIFPGKFTLLDLSNPNMPPIGIYDFKTAIDHRVLRSIHALCGRGEVPIITIPIEELIITKLWPVLEPKSVLDLGLLLCSEASKNLDFAYLSDRIKESKNIAPIIMKTMRRLNSIYEESLWSKSLPRPEIIRTQVQRLIDTLDSKNSASPV